MYELYDKNGNQIGYRMTKRIKNEDGKYDVLTARSKTSKKDCRKKLDDMVKEYYQLQEKKKSGGVFSEMKLKDYADNWYHLNIEKANCTQKNKYMYKNIVYNHIIEHLGSIKLCNLTEDDCQRFINEYAGWSKAFASKVRMVLRRILTKAEKQELIKTNVAKEWMGYSDISVTAKIYTHMVDEVFEENRMRMAQYAVTKSQQVESPTATN